MLSPFSAWNNKKFMQHRLNSSNIKNNGKNVANNLVVKPSSLSSLFNHLVRHLSHMIIPWKCFKAQIMWLRSPINESSK